MANKKKKIDRSTVEELANEIVETIPHKKRNEAQTKTDPVKWVVVRDDIRVSDEEYDNPADERAVSERDYWNRIVKKWSPREKVEIVEYDKKRHRVW